MTQTYEQKYGSIPIKPTAFDGAVFEVEVVSMKTKTVNDTPNVVYHVDFIYKCIVDGQTTSQEHSISYSDEDLQAQTNFQDFSTLTASQVETWIMDKVAYTHMQYSLASRFELAEDNTVSPPWAS